MRVTNLTKNTVLADDAAIAQTALKRLKGLLGQSSLAAGKALVIRPCNSVHTFFMRFSIDLLFVDKNNRVVKACKEIRPFRLTPVYFQSAFCIELPAGVVNSSNTQESDQLSIE